MSQRSARNAEAMATALVSDPPRPSVEMRSSGAPPFRKPLVEQRGIDTDNAGRAMHAGRPQRNLPTKPGSRIDPDRRQRNRKQAGRDLLARSDTTVIFTRVV